MARDFLGDGTTFIDCGSGGSPISVDNQHVFTYSAWIFYDTNPINDAYICSKRSSGTGDGSHFRLDRNIVEGGLRLIVNRATTNADALSEANFLSLTGWYFVACTYDGTDGPRLFKALPGGNVVESTYATQGFRTVGSGAEGSNADGNLVIGARSTSGLEGWDGAILDLRFWKVRLTIDELNQVKCGSLATQRPNLVAHLPLFGLSSPEPDHSGNGSNGTINGTMVRRDHPPGFSSVFMQRQLRVQKIIITTVTTTQTITGKARIQITTSQTETGKARIQVTTSQTTGGVARIKGTVSKTQTGVAQIAGQVLQTETGKARITATTSQTETGKARIALRTTKDQTGKANMRVATSQTQGGVANILSQNTKSQTVSGRARVTVTTNRLQFGIAKIAGRPVGIRRKPYEIIQLLQGDTAPMVQLEVTDVDQTTALDLTGYSAWVTFWTAGSSQVKTIGQAYIFDFKNGIVRYQLSAADMDTPGLLDWQWTIADPSGYEVSSPVFHGKVIARVGI